MKKILAILTLVFATSLAFGQSDYGFTTGSISTTGAALQVPLSTGTESSPTYGLPATAVFKTGFLGSGDFQNGAKLAKGTITISVSGSPVFTGNIDKASVWSAIKKANNTYYYQLSGTLTDPVGGGTGAFILQTVPFTVVGLQFPGSATIATFSVHLN